MTDWKDFQEKLKARKRKKARYYGSMEKTKSEKAWEAFKRPAYYLTVGERKTE